MPRSIAFYRDVLGFRVVSTSRPDEPWDWVLLCLGDAELAGGMMPRGNLSRGTGISIP